MTLVIESWNGKYMYGNYDGGTGRSVNQTWNCETIDSNPFSACFPSSSYGHLVYITQSCYNGLSAGDKATAKSRSQGMVGSGYFEIKSWLGSDGRYYDRKYFVPACIVECWKDSCFILRPDLSPDPCEGVICDPLCFGVDYYNTVCEEGVCVQGSLIKANDPECGYISPTPEDPDMLDIIMDNKEIIIIGAIVGAIVLKSV